MLRSNTSGLSIAVALTPVGDAPAMAAAIAAAMERTPDRRALVDRGLHYTAVAAAKRFLEIIAQLDPALSLAKRTLAAGQAY
jgi:hypothetical protein